MKANKGEEMIKEISGVIAAQLIPPLAISIKEKVTEYFATHDTWIETGSIENIKVGSTYDWTYIYDYFYEHNPGFQFHPKETATVSAKKLWKNKEKVNITYIYDLFEENHKPAQGKYLVLDGFVILNKKMLIETYLNGIYHTNKSEKYYNDIVYKYEIQDVPDKNLYI